MKYRYFPGCSAEATGKAYDISTRACARSSASSSSSSPTGTAAAPPATSRSASSSRSRVARATWPSPRRWATWTGRDLQRLLHDPRQDQPLPGRGPGRCARRQRGAGRRRALATTATVKVRHLLDVIVNDLGLDARLREGHAAAHQAASVAPYYGCQVLAPHGHASTIPSSRSRSTSCSRPSAPTPVDYPAQDQVLRRHADDDRRRRRPAALPRTAPVAARQRRRRDRHRVSAVPDEPRGLPADGQQGASAPTSTCR